MSAPKLLSVLKQTFGFSAFRPNQRVLVEGVIAGNDVFGVMPTGGGKSLCYQLPAVMLPGCAVVVSPLIALMKDQVDAALANGIKAACLNSSLTAAEKDRAEEAYRSGNLDLLYVAPERLSASGFIQFLRQAPASQPAFFAIDEAHCISEWGHDFRPDYLFLGQLKSLFPMVPVVAFTATATRQVSDDIEKRLSLRNPVRVRASFDRTNLFYEVRAKRDWQTQLVEFVRAQKGASGVIYRTTRKSVDETTDLLQVNGIQARGYHAGMEPAERAATQEAFIRDDCPVIVATVAFGMGIDKADVRFVVHVDLPKNIEGYYQETGRAGRDGDPSRCLLLYGSGDTAKLNHFILQIEDAQEQVRTRKLLQAMERFAAVPQCRRKALLDYFNEEYAEENCGGCDFCSGEFESVNATRHAQMLLSAVARTKGKFGAVHLCDIVVGAKTAKVRQFEHDQLPTYGVGKDHPKAYWRQLLDALIAGDYLALSEDQYPVPQMTAFGVKLLRGEGVFHLQRDKRIELEAKEHGAHAKNEGEYDSGLFEQLKSLRKTIADDEDVPPYVIFGDRTLRLMASNIPENMEEMSQLHGIGSTKLTRYGERFLATISEYTGSHPDVMRRKVERERSRAPSPRLNKTLSETFLTSLSMLKAGMTIEEVAEQRQIGISTVEGHVARIFESGNDTLSLRDFVSSEQEQLARDLFEQHGLDALSPIVGAAGNVFGYAEAKVVKALICREAAE